MNRTIGTLEWGIACVQHTTRSGGRQSMDQEEVMTKQKEKKKKRNLHNSFHEIVNLMVLYLGE